MKALVWILALLTLGSGLLDLYSVMGPNVGPSSPLIRDFFPLALQGFSRTTEVLTGLALVIASVHLLRRRRRAWQAAIALTALSALMHITKGLDYQEAARSAFVLAALLLSRRAFSFGSGIPSFRAEGRRILLAIFTTVAYGTVGFWVLEPVEFRQNFQWGAAMKQALVFLAFVGDPHIHPNTPYAFWFLDSLQWISIAVLVYAGFALFRPVRNRFQPHLDDLAAARAILHRYGRTAHDFYKGWPDKSIFFDDSREAFLAYRVAGGFAVVLGDPVGPRERLAGIIEQFETSCRENGWRVAFHQATPDLLPAYARLGFQRVKIGDEAIVNLEEFTLSGSRHKSLRATFNRTERSGIRAILIDPPLSHAILGEAREVSDDWLRQPGNRERGFTLGWFDEEYVRNTPLLAAFDSTGRMLAFVNLVTSFRDGEATIDLMRRRLDAPNGIMDFLLIKALFLAKERGFHRFNLGLAPMSGFQPGEDSRLDERAMHAFFQRWNIGFRYTGLKEYKTKYATAWEPRYAVFRNRLDLARLGMALARISSIPAGGR